MIIAQEAQNLPFWQDYLHTQFDPAHLLSELGVNVIEFVLIAMGWNRLIKPFLLRLFTREVHEQIDREHQIDHKAQPQPSKSYINPRNNKGFFPPPTKEP